MLLCSVGAARNEWDPQCPLCRRNGLRVRYDEIPLLLLLRFSLKGHFNFSTEHALKGSHSHAWQVIRLLCVCLHQVHGIRCDMSDPADVAVLGEYTRERLGTVHTFINNAGEVTSKRLLADVDPHEIVRVIGDPMSPSLVIHFCT